MLIKGKLITETTQQLRTSSCNFRFLFFASCQGFLTHARRTLVGLFFMSWCASQKVVRQQKFTFVCGEIDGTRRDPLGVASPQQDDKVSSELYLQIQTFPLGVSATMLMWKLYRARSRRRLNFLWEASAHFGKRNRLSKSLLSRYWRRFVVKLLANSNWPFVFSEIMLFTQLLN